MTIEEVIRQLKDLKRDRECFYSKDGDDDVFHADVEACRIAAEALEKWIPKKPNERHSVRFGDGYNDGECPNCGAVYCDSLSDTPVYCSQCGQKFDWSDEDERC